MSLPFDIIIIVVLYFLFGYTHSLLASIRVKDYLENKFGRFYLLYRISYNLLSILSIFIILKFAPKPDVIIYDLNPPYDIVIYASQLISLGGILWAGKYISLKEFIGTDQLINFFKGGQVRKNDKLIVSGPYKFSRHPIYLFSILFLGLRPQMDLFYFVSFICFTIYFYIGSIYEEKKLLMQFGQAYQDYKRNVPRIFPSIRKAKLIKNLNQA